MAREQKYLNEEQQMLLGKVLSKFNKLFDGTLGKYPHRKAHLEVEPNAKPVHSKPCSVAKTHKQVFKDDELEHLCAIGALERCGATEWAAPTFIIPQKDGRARWVSNFRVLNKVIKRKIYPLPRIQDILNKRSGYEFFTKIDISMQHCTFELDNESAELCTIVTPHGEHKCRRLPMGNKQSPDVAQEIMEDIFRDMDKTDVFIDNVGTFSNDFESHLASLEKVLKLLEDNGFTVNPLKCEWAVKETDWLGCWLTPTGLKPWNKKIKAILQMDAPKNVSQVRSFLGAVTCCRDMWPHRSHVLAPLTDLTGKGKFVWEAKHQKAFDKMKALAAHRHYALTS
jgi:hypothetical protein